MNQPLLSIAIPTFNRANKLEAQLSSLHQLVSKTLFSGHIEVVVVDNCSTDSTQDIIKSFSSLERDYIFSSYKNEKNIGSDLNFGQAILRSQGIFAWLLSDDDMLREDAIDYIYQSLNANQDVGFCLANYYTDDTDQLAAMNIHDEDFLAKNIREYISSAMFAETMVSACIFKQSLLSEDFLTKIQKGGGYLHVEWVFSILKNYNALVIKTPLFNVDHPGVYESRKNASVREGMVDFYLEAHLDFLKITSSIYKFSLGLPLRIRIYRYSINENFNQIIYHKITTDSLGYNFSALRLALPVMVRKFYFSPTFWIFHIPLLLLPSYFAKIAEPLRWKYLSFRSFFGDIIRKF